MKDVTYTLEARKTLRGLPANLAQRIRSKINQYAADPATLGNNVKALRGSPYIRLRVGDWRVVMDDRGLVLIVVRVGPRGSIYD